PNETPERLAADFLDRVPEPLRDEADAALAQRLGPNRPPEPNSVTLTCPSRRYCHSSAVGCQCSSRSEPGSSSRISPVTVFEIGNRVESTRHSRPPLNTRWGSSVRN